MPEKERAALRNGGALPPSFFAPGSGVSLWPRTIDYSCGPRIAETVATRPGDVPVFFGFPESGNTTEINERTAEIVTILNSTMVHVVFLDDADASGKIEYGHFASFKELIDWSRSLVKVLRTRFVNEMDLHRLETVLVVVCRGQQLKITEDECREFAGLVGENANTTDVEDIRPFISCYFLSRELSIDSGGKDIYASSIWDILVGRLLKAFVFSREQNQLGANSGNVLWMRPGIRIWKAEECFMGEAETAISRATENVLSRIETELRDAVVADEDGQLLAPPCPGYPSDPVESDKGIDYRGDWSRFDSAAFVREVESSEKRKASVERAAKSYFEWRLANEKPDDEELHRVFANVKETPRRLFACSKEVDRVLGTESGPDVAANRFRTLVDEMVVADNHCKELADKLAKMSGEFRLAQEHYVGIGTGLFVFAAVTAMCGVTLWQVVTLLGGSLPTVLLLIVASAVGALAATVAVVATHYHFGYAAAEAFTATCRDLDAAIALKHNKSREILCEATATRLKTRRRNLRLRLRDLLFRIRDVLVKELHYRPAVASAPGARTVLDLSEFAMRQREEYLALTSGNAASSAAHVRTEDMEQELLNQWQNSPDNSFGAKWTRFCERNDVRNAGNLPVSAFIPAMREFMSDFAREARRLVRGEIDRTCAAEMAADLKGWFLRTESVRLYSGKAAINVRSNPLKRQIFIAVTADSCHGGGNNAVLLREVRDVDHTVESEFHASPAMAETEGSPVALAIQEVEVELGGDKDSGVLALRQRSGEVA